MKTLQFNKYTIIADPQDYAVNYTIYRVAGGDLEDLYYDAKDDGATTTQDLTQAEIFLTAWVKWDGCTELSWNSSEHSTHLCGKSGITELTALLQQLYVYSAQFIGDCWDD